MTALLAIDTSAFCSVGLLHGDQLTSRTSAKTRHAAQDVLVLVDEVMNEAGLELNDLSAVTAVTGPGSFTGLRIGIGAVQGLSLTLNLPVIPISSLALLAWSANTVRANRYWMVAEQAREQEIYLGAYAVDGDASITLLGKEQVCDPKAIAAAHFLPPSELDQRWLATGNGWASAAGLKQELGIGEDHILPVDFSTVEHLCRLGAALFRAGCSSHELILPNYVKEQMQYGR